SFDQVLRQQFLHLTTVVLLIVEEEEIVRRMTGRRTCPKCGRTYHIVTNAPGKSGICDVCGSKLTQREDDLGHTVRERLRVYHQNTMDMIAHYQSQGLLREVQGAGSIEDIYARIIQVLNQASSSC